MKTFSQNTISNNNNCNNNNYNFVWRERKWWLRWNLLRSFTSQFFNISFVILSESFKISFQIFPFRALEWIINDSTFKNLDIFPKKQLFTQYIKCLPIDRSCHGYGLLDVPWWSRIQLHLRSTMKYETLNLSKNDYYFQQFFDFLKLKDFILLDFLEDGLKSNSIKNSFFINFYIW